MLRPLAERLCRDPYPVYRLLRRVSPTLRAPRGIWMLFDYESVKWALHDHETFSSRAAPPGGGPLDWLIFQDPPRHTKLRGIVTRAFTPRAIAGIEPRVRTLIHELLDSALGRPTGEMDLVADFSDRLPLLVIAEMLGIPAEDRSRFKRWSDAILHLSETLAGGERAVRAIDAYTQARAEMTPYVTDLLWRRRLEPRDDLLTRLVQAEMDGQRLTEQEMLDFFQLLLLAGSETTTNLIGNAIVCFLRYPSQLARLRQQPELWSSAIEEVLRFRSPVQAVFRTTRRDVTVHGRRIPSGALVLALLGSANRDPRQFRNPGVFDIARDPNPHVAFGHGIHFCLGAALARLEARIALPAFLERVEHFELAERSWTPRLGFHVHGPARLPLRVRTRPLARQARSSGA